MKKFPLFFLLVTACALLCSCASSPSKKSVSKGSTQLDPSAQTQGISEYDPLAQGIDVGTHFSDKAKCQTTSPLGGTEQHYFFAFDSSSVTPVFLKSLQNQADYLIKHPNVQVNIQGNTDDRGSREYNIALGWRRARAVAQLLQQYGVLKEQMKLTSFGAERPVAFGQTETAWHCNRRVDLVY